MAEEQKFYVKNPNNDFAIVQNYVIQLVAEKKITPQAMVLYTFYQSLNGFARIQVGYRYIKENTGISMGSITKCNELLEQYNLIHKVENGYKQAFTIELTPNQMIPRRELKTVQDDSTVQDEEVKDDLRSSNESSVQPMNANVQNRSSDEHIHILQQDNNYTNTTTTTRVKTKELDTKNQHTKSKVLYTSDEAEFINQFINSWKTHSQSKYYTKGDYEIVKQLRDPNDALKYIEILWCLDDIDNWVKTSDHSLSIFVKEYKSSRLQAIYPQTIYSKNTVSA